MLQANTESRKTSSATVFPCDILRTVARLLLSQTVKLDFEFSDLKKLHFEFCAAPYSRKFLYLYFFDS